MRQWLVLAALFGAFGCGSGGADDQAGTGGAGGTGGGGTGGGAGTPVIGECPPVASPGALDNVTGKWAYLERFAQLAQAPAFPDPLPQTIVFVELLDISGAPNALVVEGEYCRHLVQDRQSLVTTVIPQAYIDSLPDFTRPATFTVGSDGVGTLSFPTFFEVFGATLTDLENEALPTEPADPRVVDQDNDMQPGVTIRLTGLVDGEIYVTSRKTTGFDAIAVSADRFEGLSQSGQMQTILATDPPSIKDLSPTSVRDPDECETTATLVRVDANADCDMINAQFDSLF